MKKTEFNANYGAVFKSALDDLVILYRKVREKNQALVLDISWVIAEAFKKGNKVLLFGNGGSAADAQHLAAEFVNRFLIDRIPLPAIALHTDTSILTSISNDFSFSAVFSKQVRALGKPGDIAWGISTSGSSNNVVEGLVVAKEKGLVTIGFTGAGGGAMKDCCDYLLEVDSDYTPRIQEVHILMGHIICEIVEDCLFGKSGQAE